MPPASSPPPEFSRPFLLGRLTGAGLTVEVEADPGECERVARRLGLLGLASLRARWDLRRGAGSVIEAEGRFFARLTQECVVTLDPFESDIDERFTVRFVPAANVGNDAALDPDDVDEIPYEDDRIDAGEATVEQLALSLDPFPRKPGAVLPDMDEAEPNVAEDKDRVHPFAALAARRGGS